MFYRFSRQKDWSTAKIYVTDLPTEQLEYGERVQKILQTIPKDNPILEIPSFLISPTQKELLAQFNQSNQGVTLKKKRSMFSDAWSVALLEPFQARFCLATSFNSSSVICEKYECY